MREVSPEGEGDDEVPPDVAKRLARALDRSPGTVSALVDGELRTLWLSRSAAWLTGIDPTDRRGKGSLERVHPDDIPQLMHAWEQLKAANVESPGVAVIEPIRYRVATGDGSWMTRETIVHNMLDDPVVQGMLLTVRPVGGALDGVGHVVDLLVANAPLPEVLAACACLVPEYLGSAMVVAIIEDEPVVGVPAGKGIEGLAEDQRWWRPAMEDGKARAPVDFVGFPDDIAEQARAAGFRTVWVMPLDDATNGDVTGCVVVWVRIDTEFNISSDQGLRQTQRLAALVIGEQRRHYALRLAAVTDPLTGVGNRSALRRRLDAATGPVTMVFLDLDDFKAVNDNHGHDAGDAVLREVAERLLAAVREDDMVVRLGGDEFAIVVSDDRSSEHTPEDDERLAQRIKESMEGPLALTSTVSTPIHASVGVATGRASEVVRRADAALYQAKRRRRQQD